MNVIFTHEMDRTFVTHIGWTEPPCFMVDVQNTCVSQLTYRTSPIHRRWPEHPKLTKHRLQLQVQLELIFLLLLLQPSSKLGKTLISTWRIRIQGFHHYGSIPLLPYWGMTLPVTLL